MSDSTATILTAVLTVIASIAASWLTARITLKTKLDELRQTQLSDILRERIRTYPSLWKLCQEDISVPLFRLKAGPKAGLKTVQVGWEAQFAEKLEEWHSENGVFLSTESFQGLYRLRKAARDLAAEDSVTGEEARGRLEKLDNIWTYGFFDFERKKRDALAYQIRNDLGSYQRAALSAIPQAVPPAVDR